MRSGDYRYGLGDFSQRDNNATCSNNLCYGSPPLLYGHNHTGTAPLTSRLNNVVGLFSAPSSENGDTGGNAIIHNNTSAEAFTGPGNGNILNWDRVFADMKNNLLFVGLFRKANGNAICHYRRCRVFFLLCNDTTVVGNFSVRERTGSHPGAPRSETKSVRREGHRNPQCNIPDAPGSAFSRIIL